MLSDLSRDGSFGSIIIFISNSSYIWYICISYYLWSGMTKMLMFQPYAQNMSGHTQMELLDYLTHRVGWEIWTNDNYICYHYHYHLQLKQNKTEDTVFCQLVCLIQKWPWLWEYFHWGNRCGKSILSKTRRELRLQNKVSRSKWMLSNAV